MMLDWQPAPGKAHAAGGFRVFKPTTYKFALWQLFYEDTPLGTYPTLAEAKRAADQTIRRAMSALKIKREAE